MTRIIQLMIGKWYALYETAPLIQKKPDAFMVLNLMGGGIFPAAIAFATEIKNEKDVHRGTNAKAPKLKDYWRPDINIRNRNNYLPALVDLEGGIPEAGISLDGGVQYKF